MSESSVAQILISSNEAGPVPLGHFVGIQAGDEEIVHPNGFACPNAPCDFAVAHEIHRPATFVTTTAGPGARCEWPEAGAATGIAAGDAICAHGAELSGYVRPERFLAFLGSGTTNPLCRVVGLTGDYSFGSCGGVTVPGRLARWWRVDGLPWGTSIPSTGGGQNRRPSLDTNGNRIDALYFTGWTPGSSRDDWTSTSGSTRVGNPDSICDSWAAGGVHGSCALDQPASFRAWLSTAGQSALSRLTVPGPHVRPDGLQIASSAPDLADGHIDTGLVRDAGGFFVGTAFVWTGTSADGSFSGIGCGDWDSLSGSGGVGVTSIADG